MTAAPLFDCFSSDLDYPKVGNLQVDKKYIINPRFRMRPESGRVVLYSYDSELGGLSARHYMLHPRIAILLALMDGTRTLGDVIHAFSYIMDIEAVGAALAFDAKHILEDVRKREPSIFVEPRQTTLEHATRYDPLDFAIEAAPESDSAMRIRLDFPLSIAVHLNLQCNRRCVYCYAPSHVSERAHMPVARYDELFAEARARGAAEVRFCGSDSMLHPKVSEITAAVLGKGYDPGLSTKQYVSKSRAREFAGIGLPVMQVSLDSADPDVAARMTDCRDYLNIAFGSIENLKNAGVRVRVKAVATSINIRGIPDLICQLEDRGVDLLLIDTYGRSLFRHRDSLFASNQDLASCRQFVADYRRSGGKMRLLGGIEPYGEHPEAEKATRWRTRAACGAGRTNITIMTDGAVLVCDQVPVEPDFVFGSVRDTSIAELWNSEDIGRLVYPLQSELHPPCNTCSEFVECCRTGGRCLRDVYIATGSARGGDPKCPLVNSSIRL